MNGYFVLSEMPDYYPATVMCSDKNGAAIDPTALTLNVYEEDGADGTFSSATVTGSPFSPAKINSKTGNYGVLIAKSSFAAGKYYRFLWEGTIDGETAKWEEKYLATSKTWLSLSNGKFKV